MPTENMTPTETRDMSIVPTFTVEFWQVLLVIAIAGVLGVLLLWWDHRQSKKKKGHRVSELLMLAVGLFGGATAMVAYTQATKHKMRYIKFRIGLPVMAVAHWAFFALTILFDHPHKAIELEAVHLVIYVSLINLLGVFLTREDKRRAKRDMWRVSEDLLMAVGALGGALGMFLAMLLTHHKTRHLKFMLGLPLLFVAHVAFAFWLFSDACHIFMVWLP